MPNPKDVEYLSRVDNVLGDVIKTQKISRPQKVSNLFLDLVETIIGQQLSVKAARTIINRFFELFGDKTEITPEKMLKTDKELLRSKGISYQKISYIQSLATHILEGKLKLDILDQLPDDVVKRELVQVKGIGEWTAEMFLIFSLARPDVFSVGDLGLRTAIGKLYGIDREDKDEILKISQKWSPYRSTASLYLWSSLDNS